MYWHKLNTGLDKKQNKLTMYFCALNFNLASKVSTTGIITRTRIGMPENAIPIFVDVGQQYDNNVTLSIAQDMDIGYSLLITGSNVITYKIYNNHTAAANVNILFRVLAYV